MKDFQLFSTIELLFYLIILCFQQVFYYPFILFSFPQNNLFALADYITIFFYELKNFLNVVNFSNQIILYPNETDFFHLVLQYQFNHLSSWRTGRFKKISYL